MTSADSVTQRLFHFGYFPDDSITNNFVSKAWINGRNGDAYFAGNVGIGTTTPDNKLEVNGAIEIQVDDADCKLRFHDPGQYWYSMGIDRDDGGKFKINYGGDIGVGNNFVMNTDGYIGIGGVNTWSYPLGYRLYLNGSGYAGSWFSASSKEYKTNIEPFSEGDYANVLEEITKTKVVRYNLKENDPFSKKKHIGVIAEEAPDEIVSEDKKAIAYSEYLGFLLAAIKAQGMKISELEKRIEKLERR